jgi:hypothetical protein
MMVFNQTNAENLLTTLGNRPSLASTQCDTQRGKRTQTAVVGVTEFAYYLARTEFLPRFSASRRIEQALSPYGQIPVIQQFSSGAAPLSASERIWMMQLFTTSATGFQDRQ